MLFVKKKLLEKIKRTSHTTPRQIVVVDVYVYANQRDQASAIFHLWSTRGNAKEFRYLRTVRVTAAVYWELGSKRNYFFL